MEILYADVLKIITLVNKTSLPSLVYGFVLFFAVACQHHARECFLISEILC